MEQRSSHAALYLEAPSEASEFRLPILPLSLKRALEINSCCMKALNFGMVKYCLVGMVSSRVITDRLRDQIRGPGEMGIADFIHALSVTNVGILRMCAVQRHGELGWGICKRPGPSGKSDSRSANLFGRIA
jgi:hypothetical protein